MPRRVCTFAVAHTRSVGPALQQCRAHPAGAGPNNLGGCGLYVKFSTITPTGRSGVGNATVALADPLGNLLPGTLRPLTVHGDSSFALVPRRDVYPDRVDLAVKPGQTIAVSLYYPLPDRGGLGNLSASLPPARSRATGAPSRSSQSPHPEQPFPHRAPLGYYQRHHHPVRNSGRAANRGRRPLCGGRFRRFHHAAGRLAHPLHPAALAKAYSGRVSVCNLGIGGNRLLHGAPAATKGMYGHAGVERFRYDLLPVEGLTHAILALGTNDIGLPGKDGAPEGELITLMDYQAALEPMVDTLRRRGVKVFAGLLLPREINHIYTEQREGLRLAINQWLAGCGLFDAVLDLGAPSRRPTALPV